MEHSSVDDLCESFNDVNVSISNPEIKVINTYSVNSPNYLFIDIEISNELPKDKKNNEILN